MFSRPFRLERVSRLADAPALLREHGDAARVLAGGQSLLPLVNLGLAAPAVLVDVSRADLPASGAAAADPPARAVHRGDGYLTVGALVTHARLAADPLVADAQPLLAAAAGQIGNGRVRTRGTLGGSLAHGDPAAELPLVMVALGAVYVVSDGAGEREVPAVEFHLGYLTTALAGDELLVSARLPVLGPGWGWGFQELARRDGDFALASAAVLVRTVDGVVVESRVAVGGVADRPVRLADVETALGGAGAAELGARSGELHGIEPVGEPGASAAYKRHLVRVLLGRALAQAHERSAAA